FYKSQSPYDALLAYFGAVHNHGIHAYHYISSNVCTVHYGSVSDVSTFPEHDRFSRKHMNGAIFLHIHSVFQNNFTPITANCRSGTDIAMLADDYITCNGSQRMYETAFVDDRYMSLETENHKFLNYPRGFLF